jgi:hypothetical protein
MSMSKGRSWHEVDLAVYVYPFMLNGIRETLENNEGAIRNVQSRETLENNEGAIRNVQSRETLENNEGAIRNVQSRSLNFLWIVHF